MLPKELLNIKVTLREKNVTDIDFNDNGMRLKQFCRTHALSIPSKFFKHNPLLYNLYMDYVIYRNECHAQIFNKNFEINFRLLTVLTFFNVYQINKKIQTNMSYYH